MKTYFEHSEKERSELTREQVESLLNAELMLAGVVRPTKPVLTELDEPVLQKTVYFGLRFGTYGGPFCVFKTLAEAQAVLSQKPLKSEYDYHMGEKWQYPSEPDEVQVVQVEMYDKVDVKSIAGKLKEIAALKAANNKATEEYSKSLAALDKVTDGVWSDWQNCYEKARRIKKVADTFAEYKQICDGDASKAAVFLAKAYNGGQLEEAEAWLGVNFTAFPAPESAA